MKKLSQILLIAASLLAVAGILQVSAQTSKAATNGNAEVRKWGDWRDGRTKDQAEIRREKLAGKNDGWKTWRDRKAKGKDETRQVALFGGALMKAMDYRPYSIPLHSRLYSWAFKTPLPGLLRCLTW